MFHSFRASYATYKSFFFTSKTIFNKNLNSNDHSTHTITNLPKFTLVREFNVHCCTKTTDLNLRLKSPTLTLIFSANDSRKIKRLENESRLKRFLSSINSPGRSNTSPRRFSLSPSDLLYSKNIDV